MGERMYFSRYLILLFLFLPPSVTPAGTAYAADFLPPDQAFRVSGQALNPETILVSWAIADGYYLYRSKLGFRSNTVGIETGDPKMPPGEIKQDEFFGQVEVYRDRVDIRVPLERRQDAGNALELEISSQGCADAGLCYPPHKQGLLIDLPRLAADQPGSGSESPRSTPAAASVPTAAAIPGQATPNPMTDLGRRLGLGMQETIPTPEEAFRFSAQVAAPDRLRLTWEIADGTYLYQESIHIAVEGASDVALGPYELPEAEIEPDMARPDGTIGEVPVYHHRIDLSLPLLRGSGEPTALDLVVRYQGCAERGICYSPVTRRIGLDLPAAATVTPIAPSQARKAAMAAPETGENRGPLSESDRIASLLADGNLWGIITLFFGFGLLLAFTPCIFPMIPILSGIIVGQGPTITTRKAFLLSSVYVLAMAVTYTIAGVLAGLFGTNLQAAFQDPWIIGLFALVFAALALSMFGFYELQLPTRLQSRLADFSNRQEGGTLIGVAVMGLLSALIVGPCVAPPLAGALIFIGQTGDWLLGGVSLFALSLGMGAPLIAIGTSEGKLLPQAGPWMNAVKAVFGVALLAVAIVLLERILPAAIAMALWGLLLICSAVYMGALQQLPPAASGWRKLWQGLGFFLLIYGVLMLVGAAAGGKDTVQPLRGLGWGKEDAAERQAVFEPIKSVSDLDREIAAAGKVGKVGKPVMLDFYADWCVSCKELERYTFSDPGVIAELDRFVLLRADVTANDEQDRALMQKRFGIPGPPAILFFDAQGRELRDQRVIGYKSAPEFGAHIRKLMP